jgi:hypothetical protein
MHDYFTFTGRIIRETEMATLFRARRLAARWER